MNFSKVINNEDFIRQLNQTIKTLQKVINSDSVAYRFGNSSFVTDKLVTSLRFIQSNKGISRIIENILLETCYRSEVASANSADLAAFFTLHVIQDLISMSQSGHFLKEMYKQLDNEYIDLNDEILKKKKNINSNSLCEIIKSVVEDKRLSEMIIKSIEMAGLEGTVYPEHTKTDTYSVELVNGYRFDTSPPKTFYGQNGKWQRQFAKILVIDGIIEQVSEIHGLLESLTKTKEPCIFVARGFGDEVLSTLKLNQDRRTLDIIPIMVPHDLDGINMVNDISVVSGVSLVSPLKGDLISSVRYENLGTIESVTCQGNYLTIINNKTEKAVKSHLQNLRKKRDEQSVEDISEILLRRIRALGSYCVRLRVASKTNQEMQHDLEAIDIGLRIAKTAFNGGIVDLEDICVPDSIFGRALSNAIKSVKNKKRPATSILSATKHGISMAKVITSVEKVILSDSNE